MSSTKNYDTDKTILVGNFKAYSGEYEDIIYTNRILSPYYKYSFSHKGRTYPSLIHFLYAIRLCYKDIKDSMMELEPEDVLDFYRKKKTKCDSLFEKLGMKIGKKNYQSVDEYLVEVTKDALNILYKYFSSNKELKNALISTGVMPIVFIDNDEILGTGIRNRGLNLLGETMMKVRSYLIDSELRSSISISKLENLKDLELKYDDISDYVEYKNNNFNSVESWAFKMLLNYTNAIAYFFKYLCEERREFISIMKNTNIQELEGDKFAVYGDYSDMAYKLEKLGGIVKKIKGDNASRKAWVFPMTVKEDVKQLIFSASFGVNPIVNVNVAKYVANDIFHCNFSSEFNNIYFPEVTDNMKNTIEHMITSVFSSSDPELYEIVTVSFQTCNYIWKHICMMCEHIYVTASFEDNFSDNEEDAVKQILQASRNSVENLKRDYVDYGFNTEYENCAMQAVLYVIVALTDWLELDEVTQLEYNTMYNIVLFDLDKLPRRSVNINTASNVIKAFNEKGLIITVEVAEVIAGFVEKISVEMKRREVLNRIMFFANII